MKELHINAALNHKAESYTTKDCIVEKTINVSHQYFEKMKNNTLADDFYLKANKELMYQDENTAHCIMLLDYTTGDGLLIDSEGADYARKSQFIPNAKAIISQNEITGSEKELHRRLEEIVNSMSENSHKGENHFCLQDVLDENELDANELIRSAVGEMLAQRDDIKQVDVFHDAIDFQADIRVQPKETKELKFTCPLVINISEMDEEGDYTESEIISKNQMAGYCNEINDFIDSYAEPEENNRGLMVYEDENQRLNENVISIFPSVEVVNGELKGIIKCEVNVEIQQRDINELKERITGQMSDGWGEGFEQHGISTPDGDIYVSFWNYENWSLDEMESEGGITEESDMDMSM